MADSCPGGVATNQPGATPQEEGADLLPAEPCKGGTSRSNRGRCTALSGLDLWERFDSRGVAPGWFVAAPSGRIVAVFSEESPISRITQGLGEGLGSRYPRGRLLWRSCRLVADLEGTGPIRRRRRPGRGGVSP